MFDLNFTFRSKVKGAGMAFNFGFGNRVLFGEVCPARHGHSCKAANSYFRLMAGAFCLVRNVVARGGRGANHNNTFLAMFIRVRHLHTTRNVFKRVYSLNSCTPFLISVLFFLSLRQISRFFLNLICSEHCVPGWHCSLWQNLQLYTPLFFFSKPNGSVSTRGMQTYFPNSSSSMVARS